MTCMVNMDKSQELYSREGDNFSRFEGKTVVWEHTIQVRSKAYIIDVYPDLASFLVWLVLLRVNISSAIFKPYHDLEVEDNQSLN